jgi:hypothetical protein
MLVSSLACMSQVRVPSSPTEEDFRNKDAVDRERLTALARAADGAREDPRAQFDAGLAHAKASLVGHLEYQERAEDFLGRAARIDPQAYGAARILGRFLNMRTSVLDSSKVGLQIHLYESMLAGDQTLQTMSAEQFHLLGFLSADRALQDVAEGRILSALGRVRRLERAMEARSSARPDEVDTYAMAGTFESTFAGAIPVGRRKRTRAAVHYLQVQQTRWDELSANARDQHWAPNTRSVFALALAECLLADGNVPAARSAYRRLLDLPNEPNTGVRRQLADLAEHRLAHLDAYAGRRELLPPWPSGPTGCVGCHARETELPTDDLYLLPELAAGALPR